MFYIEWTKLKTEPAYVHVFLSLFLPMCRCRPLSSRAVCFSFCDDWIVNNLIFKENNNVWWNNQFDIQFIQCSCILQNKKSASEAAFMCHAWELDSPWRDMFHWKRFGDFVHGIDLIQLNYCIFLLKLRPFKNYSITFNIIAKHVDVYIVAQVCKDFTYISIVIVLLLT